MKAMLVRNDSQFHITRVWQIVDVSTQPRDILTRAYKRGGRGDNDSGAHRF